MNNPKFIYVSRDDMRRWQLATLEVQQALQSLFEKANITAWCGGGTLIGAVRNNGFLYWDNDLDMFFQHKDYRNILIAFWEYGFWKKFDIYYNLEGFWEKHSELTEILSCKDLDEKMLDFELNKLSKTMIKIFAKDGVEIKFYKNIDNQNEEFVKIKHFVKHHLTKQRLAYRDDGEVCFEKEYVALPNVCMLPMVNITYSTYFLSNIIYLFYWFLSLLAGKMEAFLGCVVDGDRFCSSAQKNPTTAQINEFDPARVDPVGKKFRLAFKRIYKMTLGIFQSGAFSKQFIAYRQAFFRFEVMPYPEEDIFPLRKFPFEDVHVYVPNKFEKVLEIQFGDYRKVPSVESRFGLPFFIKGRT